MLLFLKKSILRNGFFLLLPLKAVRELVRGVFFCSVYTSAGARAQGGCLGKIARTVSPLEVSQETVLFIYGNAYPLFPSPPSFLPCLSLHSFSTSVLHIPLFRNLFPLPKPLPLLSPFSPSPSIFHFSLNCLISPQSPLSCSISPTLLGFYLPSIFSLSSSSSFSFLISFSHIH